MGVLSALILILWGFRPMVLLSIFAFLCPATWWHDENVDCPHLYHVIMGSYTLIVRVLKYCLFWGFCPLWFLCFGAFVLWCFCPYWLFSVRTHDRMVRMLIVHTCIMWSWDRTPWLLESLNIFSFLGVLSALILILWGFRPMVLLSIFAFLCPATWFHDENVDCPHLYHVIMASYTLIVGVLKYFLILGVLSTLILIIWGFLTMVFLYIFAFLCPATWWHDENVDCPHLYHVIMGSYTLFVGVLKYFLIFGGFVRLDSDPLGLSSCGAFVHFCFSLWDHVMAWLECWLSTPVSCEHLIIHLDYWSLKIFSHFGGFCPPWFWSFGGFVLWCFCPFLLFSVRPRDGMTRMLIVHTCIMWSWDRTPWLLEY